MQPIEAWCAGIRSTNAQSIATLLQSLKQPPMFGSFLFTRRCNHVCQHCIYPPETKSEQDESMLSETFVALGRQLAPCATLLHAGRIICPWHIETLCVIHAKRPDIELMLVDNGTYVTYLERFVDAQLMFDRCSISCDGVEAHNTQRGRPDSLQIVKQGLANADKITKPGGIVSMFTITSLNAHEVQQTAEWLLEENDCDEVHFSPMFPYRDENKSVALTDELFARAWEGLKAAHQKYPDPKILFRIFHLGDLQRLQRIVGISTFAAALKHPRITDVELLLTVEGVLVRYIPESISIFELFVDSDQGYRTAGGLALPLSKQNENQQFTLGYAHSDSNLEIDQRMRVDRWWERFGSKCFSQERSFFVGP